MYLFEQLKKIVRPNDGFDASKRFVLSDVEIDNPVSESKLRVPCFVIEEDKVPEICSLNASAFGLQTLLDAGVALKPQSVVTTSFLRETEKFMNKIENSKIE